MRVEERALLQLLEPLVTVAAKRAARRDLDNLKNVLEAKP